MVYYGLKEVEWEVIAMNAATKDTYDTKKIIEKISYLVDEHVITIEERVRGSLYNKPTKDFLVKLVDKELIAEILIHDDKIKQYINLREQIYRKAFEDHS